MFVTVDHEYRKNKDLRREDVQELLKWIKTQPHLPPVSEMEAIQFLHSNYFKIDKAKKTIETYYTCRTRYSELFTEIDANSDELKQAHKTLTVACLPKKTHEGYRVIYTRFHDADPAAFQFIPCLKLYILLMECIISQEGTCNGYVLLYDMAGATFGHMCRLRVFAVKHYLTFVQEALPIRLKLVEQINMPSFIDALMAICSPFIKNMNLLRFRHCVEDAYETIPQEIWPKEYNPHGTEPTIKELHETWWNRIVARNDQALVEERTKCTDESKRVSSGKGLWGLLGY